MPEDLNDFLCVVLGTLIGVAVAMFISIPINNSNWREAAIKRGYAEYNSQTGNWQWKELKPESEAK